MLAAAGAGLFADPTFWVAAAFVIFVLLLIVKGVPGILFKALDDRATAIRNELDEARRLREEAQNLLSDDQRKVRQAEGEAKNIIEHATREADAMKEEARQSLNELIARRTQQAEEKIARAEAQAFEEVRSAAIDQAISVTERLLPGKVAGERSNQLIERSIQDLRDNLN